MRRKRLFSLGREEDGAVAVIVALGVTVLFGFSALAVDYGIQASTKQSLQTAADAAALAAAADVGSGKNIDTVRSTADGYCRANGFDPQDDKIAMETSRSGNTVTVSISKTVPMGFSSILTGERSRVVTASATAEAASIFGGRPYAMFAGQRIEDDGSGIIISGNNIKINGNIHSNSDISMKNAILAPGRTATAVRHVNPSSEGWTDNSIAIDMPSYSSLERAVTAMGTLVEFFGNVTSSANSGFADLVSQALSQYAVQTGGSEYLNNGLFIHVRGNLTFNGHAASTYEAEFPITLLVDGDINLNGAPLNSTADTPVTIISRSGNITVNGGGATYTGILFAPEGDITLNGNDADFVGSIIANNIRKTGGKINVTYDEDVDRFLPKTRVRLLN